MIVMNSEKNKANKRYNLATYISILIVCMASIFILVGIRKAAIEYKNDVYTEYTDNKLEEFNALVYSACELGHVDLLRKAEAISMDIKTNLDMDKLRDCMDNNLPYPEFDGILRKHLQGNAFINTNAVINRNRNNIFVIINGKMVATYIHGSQFTGDAAIEMGSSVTPQDLINEYFYNPELSNDAIEKILRQYNGLIVWQQRKPIDSSIPKYTTFGMDDLAYIYENYGIDGFESFDILLPVYITEYGNIFGDYDVPGESKFDDNNKIIIVQKLNLKDYIEFRFPDILNQDTAILTRFEHLSIMVNIFIILQCLALLSYAFIFIVYYNHRIALEQEEEARLLLEKKNSD